MANIDKKNIVVRITDNWRQVEKFMYSATPPFPHVLMLELTNACNLKCIMCRNASMKRKRGFMPTDLAQDAISQARDLGIKRVALYTTGESLLHPSFIKIVKICKKLKVYCYLTSNGTLLNKRLSSEIIDSGLDSIKFSVDHSAIGEYEGTRIGANYKRLIKNLSMLKQLRDSRRSRMKIYIGAIVMRTNEENMSQFKKFFRPYVDDICFSPLVNQGGNMNTAYNELSPLQKIKSCLLHRPCRLLWDRIVISWEGYLTACCLDYEMDLVYGELTKMSMKDAWNSLKMRQWREFHLKGDLSKMPLCGKCNAPHFQNADLLTDINKAR